MIVLATYPAASRYASLNISETACLQAAGSKSDAGVETDHSPDSASANRAASISGNLEYHLRFSGEGCGKGRTETILD